jgi:hypothetical protein
MYIGKETVSTEYTRVSKLGNQHSYFRNKTVVILCCDNCDGMFRRDLKKIDPKRLSNNYFHVCENCNSKQFAQRKGVERKQIWDMPASVELPVRKF